MSVKSCHSSLPVCASLAQSLLVPKRRHQAKVNEQVYTKH
jgi:hypothetical protein